MKFLSRTLENPCRERNIFERSLIFDLGVMILYNVFKIYGRGNLGLNFEEKVIFLRFWLMLWVMLPHGESCWPHGGHAGRMGGRAAAWPTVFA